MIPPGQSAGTEAEHVFYDHGCVKVTNARFIVEHKTYAMRNITSVAPVTKRPSRIVPFLILVLGFWIGVHGLSPGQTGALVIGGIIFLTGLILWSMMKPLYIVALQTAGGELQAVNSRDWKTIQAIVNAINEAIMWQGR